jgi:hypothetical protein
VFCAHVVRFIAGTRTCPRIAVFSSGTTQKSRFCWFGVVVAGIARSTTFRDGVDDGTRTRDGRNHNPGLYQLSYVHHKQFAEPRS